MKRLFFLGDFSSENGPGIANRSLKENIEKYIDQYNCSVTFSNEKTILKRTIEILKQTKNSDCIIICNYTRLHLLAVFWGNMIHKEIIYRMHGTFGLINLKDKESEIEDIKHLGKERYILSHAKKIITVSKTAMIHFQEQFPKWKEKLDYVYNSIDTERYLLGETIKKNRNWILSTGGGMKQKNNIVVAKAIDYLNKNGYNLSYYVIGQPYPDKPELEKCPCVRFIEKMSHEELVALMGKSYIYVQNSTFDTFGIAVIEAALKECRLLLSDAIGAKEILEGYYSIKDSNDIINIANSLKEILQEEKTTIPQVNLDDISGEKVVNKFLELCLD